MDNLTLTNKRGKRRTVWHKNRKLYTEERRETVAPDERREPRCSHRNKRKAVLLMFLNVLTHVQLLTQLLLRSASASEGGMEGRNRKLSGNSDPSPHIWCLSVFFPQEMRDTRGEMSLMSLTSFNVVFNNYEN